MIPEILISKYDQTHIVLHVPYIILIKSFRFVLNIEDHSVLCINRLFDLINASMISSMCISNKNINIYPY